MPTKHPEVLPDHADVVIVGAGAAGLYCAWRLLRQNQSRSVVILERLNRTGGRLDTDLIKVEDDSGTGQATVKDEEGGMRFFYSMHELMALFSALNLCDDIVPFPMSDPNNRRYFRGHGYTNQELADDPSIWGQLYNLDPPERGKSPVQIVTDVYHQLLAQNGMPIAPASPTPEFWQKFRLDFKWKKIPLNEWQLWGLLRDFGYSQECITMLSETLGFEAPFLAMVNAGEAFQILEDFPKNPQFYTLRRGFSTLPNKLAKEVEDAAGQIFLGVNIDQITADSSGYSLQVTVAPPDESSSPHVEGGTVHTVTAPKVILAVASNALESLYTSSPALKDRPNAQQLLEDIHGVLNMRLMKINLYYNEPWWANELVSQKPFERGPSFTDLPINSVYPFTAIAGQTSNEPAALTIYCDFSKTDFWRGLQNLRPLFTSPLQEEHSKPPQVLFAASRAVVDEATRQLKELFATHWVPEPVLTSYRFWGGQDDLGYGYHQWALNADDREIMQRLVEPVPNIHVCGEAYSDMQGWVNGSLRSADLVLAKFDLNPLTEESSILPCQDPGS